MALTINGRSLASMGLSARRLSGWLDGPAAKRDGTPIPGLLGVLPDRVATATPRTLQVTLNVPVASLTDRPATLAALQDALAGELAIRTDDAPGRVIRATCDTVAVASVDEAHGMAPTAKNLLVSFTLTAWDGASYDAEPTLLVLGATPTAVPLGTLPSVGVLHWSGAWSEGAARTLTYRGANGITYGSLTITPPSGSGGLSSSEFLEVDLARRYLTKVSSTGVRTNAYAWKSAGAWFAPDASDVDRRGAANPTLDVSAGVGVYLYRKAWAL